MKILILGGTGAIGNDLVNILVCKRYEIRVTSRKEHCSKFENLKYIQGDAHDMEFINQILADGYDAIVDFMIYTPKEFEQRMETFLKHTNQYIFLSSSRVYADSKKRIKENSPRLLDVSDDIRYLKTNEYALAKSREEDILLQSGFTNWTIIRPYITYSEVRLQLGVLEKERWLYRALQGRSIVFFKDMNRHITSMTYGYDVAGVIADLIGNEKAYGECFHIVGWDSMEWRDVLNIYLDVIEKKTGKRPRVFYCKNSDGVATVLYNEYQIHYDRLFDRRFDSTKIDVACGRKVAYTPMSEGLEKCLFDLLNSGENLVADWRFEAWADRQTHEKTPLSVIHGGKNKAVYILNRWTPYIEFKQVVKKFLRRQYICW